MSHIDVGVGNDEMIQVDGVQDGTPGLPAPVYFNAATAEFTVIDDKGAEVPGQVWPTAMTYVAASDGIYRGLIGKGAQLVAGKMYQAIITADAGPGFFGKWTKNLRAKVRK